MWENIRCIVFNLDIHKIFHSLLIKYRGNVVKNVMAKKSQMSRSFADIFSCAKSKRLEKIVQKNEY